MIDDHPDLQRRYRAPRAFGPMPGPRNIPASQRDVPGRPDEVSTSVSVSLEADPAELARLLPPATRLSGAAVLTVTITRFENLLWLAGRGYPILTVTFPVEYRGDTADDGVQGRYLAVLWEGLADPVTTGRDELGFPKLPADISGPLIQDVSADGAVEGSASWDGFRFLQLSAEDLRRADPAGATPPKGTIVHRYVPSPVEPDRADIDQLIFHPMGSKRPTVTDRLAGSGSFHFHHAQFADSQESALEHVAGYTIVNDMTTRDLVHRRDMPKIGTDWFRGKNSPGFLPTGPWLVPADLVGDPQELQITLALNGDVMQDESTKDMMFGVARLVSAASQTVPLLPGDLLLTGSPAGNGIHHGRLLRVGDVMESTITGLGRQRTTCVAPAAG